MAADLPTRLFLILLAGGQGSRAATSVDAAPKQFQSVGSQLLFQVSVCEFLSRTYADFEIAGLTMVAPTDWHKVASTQLEVMNLPIPWQLAPAGLTRTLSTWSAINMLTSGAEQPGDNDLVAVHDAARPFATAELLSRLGECAIKSGAAVPGIPVPDTIVQVSAQDSGASSTRYLDRSSLVAVQTPQVFRWDIFLQAHSWANNQQNNFTDDGSLLASRGSSPIVVVGDTKNWKVTTNSDLQRAIEHLNRISDN